MEEFIEVVKSHIPFDCDEEDTVLSLVVISVKSILANRYDTRINHND